jgi:AhpD family alkylhydroperoxidase
MEKPMYPAASRDIAQEREKLAPEILKTFRSFSHQVFVDGALPSKTKELIAIAVAHVTQCPYCIRSHTKRAKLKGASGQEIMEAIWVAAEMRAGGAISHSALAIDTMNEDEAKLE